MSVICPFFPGYCKIAPKNSDEKSKSASFPMTNSIPIGVERVCNKDSVWGSIASETKNLLIPAFF